MLAKNGNSSRVNFPTQKRVDSFEKGTVGHKTKTSMRKKKRETNYTEVCVYDILTCKSVSVNI